MCCAVSLVILVLVSIPILLVYLRVCLQHDVSPLFAAAGGVLIWVLLPFCIGFPCLAAEIRRLHDVGRSGRTELWWLVPIIGWIKMFRILSCHGDRRENEYGAPAVTGKAGTES